MEFPPVYFDALNAVEGIEPTAKNIERLSERFGVGTTQWAFSQWQLRRRGREKFVRADRMLFVREALEQASHERVAAYHASLFPSGARVMDMTAGIGGDMLALAARCGAVGYELDPERACCLRWNLSISGLSAEVCEGDSVAALGSYDYVFADPARRVGGKRTLRVEEFTPDPIRIAHEMAQRRLGVIKLSPLVPDETLVSLGGKLEFVSWKGECREVLVHCGADAEAGRWAVQLDSNSRLESSHDPRITNDPGEFIFEADPAAVRAHALGSLATKHQLEALGSSTGYLTGHEATVSPWLTAYRNLVRLPFDIKKISDELKRRNARAEAVKVKGANVRPAEILAKLPRKGEESVFVAIYLQGGKPRVLVLSRLT